MKIYSTWLWRTCVASSLASVVLGSMSYVMPSASLAAVFVITGRVLCVVSIVSALWLCLKIKAAAKRITRERQ